MNYKIYQSGIPAILFLAGTVCGFNLPKLAGDLPPTVGAYGVPYLVTSDIFVPPEKTVLIEPGTVFLFKKSTKLFVRGVLNVRGTNLRPVIFTSEKDQSNNTRSTVEASPGDWEGIILEKDALGTSFENFQVLYAAVGINSSTRFFRINSGSFRSNEKSNLVIERKEFTVGNEPYSYAPSVQDEEGRDALMKMSVPPNALKKNIARYSGLVLLLGGCGFGIWSAGKWTQAKNQADEIRNAGVPVTGKGPYPYLNADYQNALKNSARYRTNTIVGVGVIGMLGACGFTWSYTF